MKKLLFLAVLLWLIVVVSCSEKEAEIEVSSDDKLVFETLYKLAVKAESLWPGFDYVRSKPSYLILRNSDGDKPRGYLLNPVHPLPAGSIPLSMDKSGGLIVYRNDNYFSAAYDALGEDGLFDFGANFSIDGVPYFLLRSKPLVEYTFYDVFKSNNGGWVPLVVVHELFHTFQIAEWTYPTAGGQDFYGYPLTVDVMTYQLALFALMKEAHTVTGDVQAREYLAKYIVLFEKMIEVDPTSVLLVRNMGIFQQFLEGPARYVEHFGAAGSIYPDIQSDPTHGFDDYIDAITTPEPIRHVFAVRTWHHAGAGAIHLLKEAGVPVHDLMKQGKTPWDLALELVPMTNAEKVLIHDQLTSALGWNAYVVQATYLYSLL